MAIREVEATTGEGGEKEEAGRCKKRTEQMRAPPRMTMTRRWHKVALSPEGGNTEGLGATSTVEGGSGKGDLGAQKGGNGGAIRPRQEARGGAATQLRCRVGRARTKLR